MIFTFIKVVENIKRRIIFCDTNKLYKIQISLTRNKVLLEHSPAHSLRIIYGSFHMATGELSNYDRDGLANRVSNLYYLAHYRKKPYRIVNPIHLYFSDHMV